MTPIEITNKLYAAFGTDSGILFGIKERQIVEHIVEFTAKHLETPELPLNTGEQSARENDLIEKIKGTDWEGAYLIMQDKFIETHKKLMELKALQSSVSQDAEVKKLVEAANGVIQWFEDINQDINDGIPLFNKLKEAVKYRIAQQSGAE